MFIKILNAAALAIIVLATLLLTYCVITNQEILSFYWDVFDVAPIYALALLVWAFMHCILIAVIRSFPNNDNKPLY